MLTERERKRMNELRAQELKRALTEQETQELNAFLARIEDEEAAYLRPAVENAKIERSKVEAQNDTLKRLISRQERLMRRLTRLLALATAEREAIRAELTRVLSVGSNP